jgi:xanthosine utilization system XapX-like protein
MAAINTGRVIAGGLVAGLIINVVEFVMNMFVLAGDMKAVYDKMGVAEPAGGAIGGFVVLAFLLGLLLAWVYAAIRPRYGAGPRTAVTAALMIWLGACLFPIAGWVLMGMYPLRLASIGLLYGLVEFVIGALAAGAIYQERAAT